LSRSRKRQDPRVSDQPVCAAGADHLRPVPVPMAGGVVFQVDQATPAHQALLRHLGKRRADANLDCHQRLCVGGDHQKATSSGCDPAYAATDFVADALREIADATSVWARRSSRGQPYLRQAAEIVRVLTGHYWVRVIILLRPAGIFAEI